MPAPDTHAAIEWPTLMTVCAIAATHFARPITAMAGDTRIDDLTHDEIALIDFTSAVEAKLHCNIPDLDIGTTLTLAQLATLAEKYRVKK